MKVPTVKGLNTAVLTGESGAAFKPLPSHTTSGLQSVGTGQTKPSAIPTSIGLPTYRTNSTLKAQPGTTSSRKPSPGSDTLVPPTVLPLTAG